MKKPICLTIAIAFFQTCYATAASFQGLGDLPGGSFYSYAYGVSADGSTVVGGSNSASGWEAIRWTSGGGMVGLGDLPGGSFDSDAYGVSADGATVVGYSSSFPAMQAFRWTSKTGMVGLGDLPGSNDYSEARDVSANGATVVGWSDSARGREAFRWTEGSGMVGLGDLPGDYFFSRAFGVSADGLIVVGGSRSASGSEAFRWTSAGGMVGLGDLPGAHFRSEAHAVSADGYTVVGWGRSASGSEAFRWTLQSGIVGLGDLPGGRFESDAYAVTGDGSTVVGVASSPSGLEAFISDGSNGMRNLKDVLTDDFCLDLTGWTLSYATDISDDGTVIVGHGYNPSGDREAWRAVLSEPTLTSVGSGNWNHATTWDGATLTPSEQYETVVGGHTITVATDGNAFSLRVDAGGEVLIGPGSTLSIVDSVDVAGTLVIAPAGAANVGGNLTMQEGSMYVCQLGRTAPGVIDVAGDVQLDGQNALTLKIDGSDPFQKGSYPLITSAEQARFTGEFDLVSNLGAYVTDNGLSLDDGTLTLTLDKSLNPGDANLDGVTDVRDFNKWNAAKFTSDTDWASGDFDGDGITDVRDFNKWNAAKFTSAEDNTGNPIVEGQVPEPSSLLLLAGGMLGWLLAWQRFPIRFPSRSLGTRET